MTEYDNRGYHIVGYFSKVEWKYPVYDKIYVNKEGFHEIYNIVAVGQILIMSHVCTDKSRTF